jgi:hypothetical protein
MRTKYLKRKGKTHGKNSDRQTDTTKNRSRSIRAAEMFLM